jgi:hypothetical protein
MGGCSYHRAHMNLEDYSDEMPLSPAPFEGERLGKVSANGRGAIWNDCTRSAEGAVWELMDQTRRMGGNAIGDIRWIPKQEKRSSELPTCKRGWAWFLVWPVLVTPVFMSTRVEGYAYRVPDSELTKAGLHPVPADREHWATAMSEILEQERAGETARGASAP